MATPNYTFSCFIPRIDTRSLPPMSSFEHQADYLAETRHFICDAFTSAGLGRPCECRLLQRFTSDGYLFFVGFVHYNTHPNPSAPSQVSFRNRISSGEEVRLSLAGGAYWRVRKYVRRAAATIADQNRLQLTPPASVPIGIPLPRLVRDGGRVLDFDVKSQASDISYVETDSD